MKWKEVLEIIGGQNSGFMVSFERLEGAFLHSDYFPDKHAGEELIETEAKAWEYAKKFAEKTVGKCVNIYVIDHNFVPVANYKDLEIYNR